MADGGWRRAEGGGRRASGVGRRAEGDGRVVVKVTFTVLGSFEFTEISKHPRHTHDAACWIILPQCTLSTFSEPTLSPKCVYPVNIQ